MNLRSQRNLASKVLNVGRKKVKIDSDSLEDVSKAITREDIKGLISEGVISKETKKGTSRSRARKRVLQKKKGQRKGHGKRKGTKQARGPKKEKWMGKIRALRDELKKLKSEGKIDAKDYRKFYRQIKGNVFTSRRHLREHTTKE